jgi:hypothetical protein
MNTAGGPVQPDERWPGYPMATPRGPREQAWHTAVGLCVLAAIGVPQLRVLVPIWVLMLVLSRYALGWLPPAWLLQRTTLLVSSAAGLFLFARLGQSASWQLLGALVRDDTQQIPELLAERADQGALLVLCQAGAGFIVSTLLRFDLRAVRRDIVDERVWARQQARRRQVMAAHHRRQPPPETV